MRRRCSVALVLLAGVLLPRHATAQVKDVNAIRAAVAQAGGRVIVTLKSARTGVAIRAPGSDPIAADELNAIQGRIETTYPVQVHRQLSIIGAMVVTVSDAALTRLAADSSVAAIEPDVKNYLTAAASTTVARRPARARADGIPWGVADVNAPAAWAAGITGAGVKVGIMDTGIDYTHPDLVVTGGYDFYSGSPAPADYNDTNSSCDGHGTHVAGIVAARQNGFQNVGVAPNVTLYALHVFNPDAASGCFAFTSSQIAALQWAVTNHLDVVSISIGNSSSNGYANAVASATAAGVVVVAAAGNGGGPGVVYPAAAPGAIAVAALDPGNTVAGYSSSGPEVWIAAPGSSIESTVPGGGTGFKSGTSMATPHVTGIVALIRQMHPAWTADQIRTELKNDAIDVAAAGFDNNSGWGLVQAPPTGVVPVSVAVNPVARGATIQQGNAAPGDNATVTLSGTNAASTAWTATKKKTWTSLTTASGTGSGTVAWSRNATGLAAGTYVDTITVTAASASAVVYDTLKITAVIPVTVAVNPAARSVAVQQGTAAAGDNAAVTLSGTNAASTGWSATKKKSWTTLTTASGTGSGTVAWSRNTIGLAVGTYIDTITVSAASSSATIFDTLTITAAPVPIVVATNPVARAATAQQGNAAPGDNAAVTLTGTNAASTAWSATKKKAWTTLTTGNGTGNGTVAWSRNTIGLAVGTYIDTITVSAASSSATIFDTLTITSVAAPLTLSVNPAARSASVQQGNAAPSDAADVILSGTNSANTTRSATHRQPWLSFSNSGGTGSGTIRWDRNASGLAVGTYVDTITVTAASLSATVYDTLKVTAGAFTPLVVAVAPTGRKTVVQQGTAAAGDNAAITITGTNAASAPWTATKKQAWLTLTTASGTGSGTLSWSRNASGLGVGTYVDTISVAVTGAAGSPATVVDTLQVTAGTVAVVLGVNPMSRKATVVQGSAAPGDNMAVTLTGTGAASVTWWAVKHQPWLTLTSAAGIGGGTIAWTRNATGLAVGVYVDTIVVSSSAAPAVTVYDTLAVTAAPVAIAVAVNPVARSVAIQQGSAAPADNAAVTLTGTNSAATGWTAGNRKSWLALANSSGTGNGTLTWTRNASGLAAGTYVDTITVTAASATATLFDTLRITPVVAPVTMAVSPLSRHISVPQGTPGWGDNAQVTFTGTNAQGASWTADHSSTTWADFVNVAGTGDSYVTWNRNITTLAAGTYVDTITVRMTGTAQSFRVLDSVTITPIVAPAPTIAVNPRGRKIRNVGFSGSSLVQPGADSALVEATASDSIASGGWVAAVTNERLVLVAPSGALDGYVKWSRPAQALNPGLYVDTVIVSLQRDPSVRAQFVDSLEVVAVAIPVPDAAVGDLFDHISLTDDQRVALDRSGNNNGRYDLGDFLAWVSRNHIRLSASASQRLSQLPIVKAGGP